MYDVRSFLTTEKLERMGSNHQHTGYAPVALPPTELRSTTAARGLAAKFLKGGFHLLFLKSIVMISHIKCVILCHLEIAKS